MLFFYLYSLSCLASTEDDFKRHPLYVGVTGGYGSTTWTGLVPLDLSEANEETLAMKLATPVKVDEGGGVWGGFAGFEFIPQFALEASYMHYHDARVIFDELSSFTDKSNGLLEFVTQTETITFMGKFMLFIPRTKLRVYSSIGGAALHRKDMLRNSWRYTPTFGVGLNTNFNPHVMGEIAGNFTAGYGEARMDPTIVYFPFLYSVFARLAYRF